MNAPSPAGTEDGDSELIFGTGFEFPPHPAPARQIAASNPPSANLRPILLPLNLSARNCAPNVDPLSNMTGMFSASGMRTGIIRICRRASKRVFAGSACGNCRHHWNSAVTLQQGLRCFVSIFGLLARKLNCAGFLAEAVPLLGNFSAGDSTKVSLPVGARLGSEPACAANSLRDSGHTASKRKLLRPARAP